MKSAQQACLLWQVFTAGRTSIQMGLPSCMI